MKKERKKKKEKPKKAVCSIHFLASRQTFTVGAVSTLRDVT
jgi:hypothetical protein